ncbi:hypothetical protein NQ318_020207 [Aromia moschata]|uniref:Uncharacterized protein n=1 Tax=Aromia moschata TaxID=1265417 RepID=A0AAV8ZAV2_9CUCU|nr:hypothetical protein NQ318_020207 [Aromia moschata]
MCKLSNETGNVAPDLATLRRRDLEGGNELMYTDETGNLVLYSLEDSTSKVLLQSTDSLLTTAFDFQLSPDGLYLLVAYNYHKIRGLTQGLFTLMSLPEM